MRLLLDRVEFSRSVGARLIIDHLSGALYHMTNLQGYQGIVRDLVVRPNDGTGFSFPESKLSNFYELKAVSLWDFELLSPTVTFDDLLLRKCETVPLRHQAAIFIGFTRDRFFHGGGFMLGTSRRMNVLFAIWDPTPNLPLSSSTIHVHPRPSIPQQLMKLMRPRNGWQRTGTRSTWTANA
jgi:hypothetical protein